MVNEMVRSFAGPGVGMPFLAERNVRRCGDFLAKALRRARAHQRRDRKGAAYSIQRKAERRFDAKAQVGNCRVSLLFAASLRLSAFTLEHSTR